MRRPTKLSASPLAWFSPPQRKLPKYCVYRIAAVRRALALALAILLPMWQTELFAQQQETAPVQLRQPGQDYSGQIQTNDAAYPAQQPYQAVDTYSQQPGQPAIQPLDAGRLQQLVAPIALYPDTLVALVLTASTYPAQVQNADRWLQAQGNFPAEQIAAGANVQNWDPSVKALTAFPQVLAQMDQNPAWTADLGTAYFNQPSDVLEAVQVMRARAQAAGNLQPTLQQAVNYVGGNIELAPVNPQVVYVPAYNPWMVYGQPVDPYPGFSLVATLGSIGSFLGSAAIHWGPGIAMTAFTSMPWGLLAWGVSWLVQAILFHNSNYYSQSTMVADWGFPHGGPRAWQAFAGGVNSYPQIQRGYNSGAVYGAVHRPPNSYDYARGGYATGPGNAFVHRPPSNAQVSVARPPNPYARSGGGYTMASGYGFAPRPGTSSSGYRPVASPNRGYQGYSFARASQPNYSSPSVHRPPTGNPVLSARLQQPSFSQRSSPAYASRGFGGSVPRQASSGGFHPFGSGLGSESFKAPKTASFHAPKAESFHTPKMKAPKGYGGGHSGGGGHSVGGKHHH
jgi:Protein of unknown function (DUF3300)